MLSILIPTYNFDLTDLLSALHHQIQELDAVIEVLVCDDCSGDLLLHDQNMKTAFSFGFEYHRHKQNRGRTATRNYLADKSNHSWLLFLDADVLPSSDRFLARLIPHLAADHELIFGGIAYRKERPDQEQMLRYVYGKKREAKSVAARKKSPYFIISQSLCIKKELFLKCNTITTNGYGLDNLFSNNLKRLQAQILHIDNPVIHLGLENSHRFMEKSLEGIATTVTLEKSGLMDADLRPIQRMYRRLKKYGLLGVFSFFSRLMMGPIKANLNSNKPSLLLFDIYRMNHLIQLKK